MPSRRRRRSHWELAADERFRQVVRSGVDGRAAGQRRTPCTSSCAGCCRAASTSTGSGRTGIVSPVGRTRTAPAPWASCRRAGDVVRVLLAVRARLLHRLPAPGRRTSPSWCCTSATTSTSTRRTPTPSPAGNPRDHEGPETRHAGQLPAAARRSTRPTRTCRPRTPSRPGRWSSTTTRSRTTGPTRCPSSPIPDFLARRAAAFQAYYENMPLRRTSIPRGIDMQLYRRLRWGRLATVPPARHPPVPRRPGLRRRLPGLPGRARPGPLDHRRRAGEVAAGRLPPVDRALGRARPAGLLRPAGQQRRPGDRGQHGLLGRLRRVPRPGGDARWWSRPT